MTWNRPPGISIVCPAYDEEDSIEGAVAKLRECLSELPTDAEVLIINDGSSDRTVEAATRAIGADERFRIVSHRANFGRGRALRTGFWEAEGQIIITTEADLSWGKEVIRNMLDALDADPRLDAVFASPHLSGGGYRNVPWYRVMLSRIGNRVLRALYPSPISMTTGMTRAYRAEVIKGQRFSKDGKELHLEIAHRLMALGYRIGEIPAILTWPLTLEAGRKRRRRTDWRKIRGLVASHLAFGVLQGISRVIGPIIVLLTMTIGVFAVWAIRNLIVGAPSIYLATLDAVLIILWVTLTVGYFLLSHVFQVQEEIWRVQQLVGSAQAGAAHPDPQRYYSEEPLPGSSRHASGQSRSF